MLSAYIATARAAALPPPTPTDPVAEATRKASIPKPTPSRATARTVRVRLPRLRTTPCDGPTTTIASQMAAATTRRGTRAPQAFSMVSRVRRTGVESSRSMVPFCSSPASARLPASTPITSSSAGTMMLKSSVPR